LVFAADPSGGGRQPLRAPRGSAADRVLHDRFNAGRQADHFRLPRCEHAAAAGEKIIDGLTAFRHLHISGYTLIGDDQFEAVKRILLSAKQTGLTVSLDPGVCSSEQSREKILSMLIHVDYFLPDLAELAQLTGDLPLDDQLEALLERGCRAVALKMGEHGSRYIDADQAVQQPAVRREGARIISTNGAGDCFNAGFIAAILAGRSPKEALQAGNGKPSPDHPCGQRRGLIHSFFARRGLLIA
jgi:sugar/nucleoside kinase (ribokinase family)